MHVASRPGFSLDSDSLRDLLPEAAPPFLLRQRWFGARSAPIRSVSLLDAVPVPDPDLQVAHVLLRVELANDDCSTYQLVVALTDPRAVEPSSILAQVTTPERTVCVHDILRSPAECESWLRALARHHGSAPASARLAVEWTPALARLAPPFQTLPLDVEQSNSSVILGQGAVVKLFRRVEPGLNPDVELTAALTAAGFRSVPAHLGSVSYETPAAPPFTLAAIQQYMPHESDGWSDARRRVAAYLEDPSQARVHADAAGARSLGEVVARMHQELASVPGPAWQPEPMGAADLQQWRDRMLRRLDRAAPALAQHDQVRQELDRVARRVPALPQAGTKIRIHGDLHLGQVLQTAEGWVVFDFEGEPSRPLAERAAKHSPLRDVAGMLRSYDYAAFSALFDRAAPGSEGWQRLEPLALSWESAMRTAFVEGWTSAADPSWLPAPEYLPELLELWELDKAVYELGYELDHRPGWLRIPMHGIHRIISRKRA